MVKLRLRRKGRAHYPVYDIVAVSDRARRDGSYLERLGYYNPNNHPNTIVLNHERALYWLNVGAQATPTLNHLLSYEGVLLRKHLAIKGKSSAEIEEAVVKHKDVVAKRYDRRKQLRAKRKEAKAKAEAAAKANG
ncbi:MAG TPA: 30S ribosomal protein S16 [Candidatus Kapabacteria bacterium]|nr:30S ribosomal protein S16 [Candidatus Kapabacteria bacterium]